MPCTNPLRAVQGADPLTGEVRVVFGGESRLLSARAIEVPCGQCRSCRVSRARAWAIRCMHEARCHSENCFLTLTYAPEHVPAGLVVRDLQLFFKRLRYFSGAKFRYFAVGEYGKKLSRPHYHALLFGFDFPDKEFFKGSGLSRQYRSDLLDKSWQLGHALSGTVTTASAQYVAKYAVKRVTGKAAADHYRGRVPEFAVMSRRPGIGASWISQFGTSVFPRDFVVVPGGKRTAVPRYYLDRQDVELRERVKAAREERNKPDDPWLELQRRPAVAKYVDLMEKHFNERRELDEDSSLRGI